MLSNSIRNGPKTFPVRLTFPNDASRSQASTEPVAPKRRFEIVAGAGDTARSRKLTSRTAARWTPADDAAAYLPLAAQAQQLVSPAEMGELFKVIALGRNFPSPLLGFARGDKHHTL